MANIRRKSTDSKLNQSLQARETLRYTGPEAIPHYVPELDQNYLTIPSSIPRMITPEENLEFHRPRWFHKHLPSPTPEEISGYSRGALAEFFDSAPDVIDFGQFHYLTYPLIYRMFGIEDPATNRGFCHYLGQRSVDNITKAELQACGPSEGLIRCPWPMKEESIFYSSDYTLLTLTQAANLFLMDMPVLLHTVVIADPRLSNKYFDRRVFDGPSTNTNISTGSEHQSEKTSEKIYVRHELFQISGPGAATQDILKSYDRQVTRHGLPPHGLCRWYYDNVNERLLSSKVAHSEPVNWAPDTLLPRPMRDKLDDLEAAMYHAAKDNTYHMIWDVEDSLNGRQLINRKQYRPVDLNLDITRAGNRIKRVDRSVELSNDVWFARSKHRELLAKLWHTSEKGASSRAGAKRKLVSQPRRKRQNSADLMVQDAEHQPAPELKWFGFSDSMLVDERPDEWEGRVFDSLDVSGDRFVPTTVHVDKESREDEVETVFEKTPD